MPSLFFLNLKQRKKGEDILWDFTSGNCNVCKGSSTVLKISFGAVNKLKNVKRKCAKQN